MRSYTNKESELITVTKEHLDTGVRIKKELQKSNPSRRCSWALLVKLMIKEGFYDAENSESYRCMIKAYQKSIGELPEVTKYADMVADSKLDSIKEIVGDLRYEKEDNKKVLREVNKGVKTLVDFATIAEQIGNAFIQYDFSELVIERNPIQKGENKMFIAIADLHIGALVNNEINIYNYEVAKRRINEYLDKLVYIIETNNISEVFVGNLGDSIEHPYMHNLAYNSEFVLSEQIVRASDLIIKFLVGLSKYVDVRVAGIGGNHDRISENKKVNLNGDHAVKAINYAIQSFIENADIEGIIYEQSKDYEHSVQLNGINIKMIHGDLDPINEAVIAKHSSLDGINYNIVVMGHYHHYRVIETSIEKYLVVFGSLKGADDFGVQTRRVSSASQGCIIVSEDGEIEIKKIKLR